MAVSTTSFDNAAKQMLEELFGMSTGYVLDFTNSTFASFVETCIGFNPYERYDGSKAVILRQIWLQEPFADVAKLNLDLLERWRLNKLRANQEPTQYEAYALDKLVKLFTPGEASVLSADDLAFSPSSLSHTQRSTQPRHPRQRRRGE